MRINDKTEDFACRFNVTIKGIIFMWDYIYFNNFILCIIISSFEVYMIIYKGAYLNMNLMFPKFVAINQP